MKQPFKCFQNLVGGDVCDQKFTQRITQYGFICHSLKIPSQQTNKYLIKMHWVKLSCVANQIWIMQHWLETLRDNVREAHRQGGYRFQWMKDHMADCKQSSYATIWDWCITAWRHSLTQYELSLAAGWAVHRSVWEGRQNRSPFRAVGTAGSAHPPPTNVSHVSTLSVACFPHRRGREGERSAIIMLGNMHESVIDLDISF